MEEGRAGVGFSIPLNIERSFALGKTIQNNQKAAMS